VLSVSSNICHKEISACNGFAAQPLSTDHRALHERRKARVGRGLRLSSTTSVFRSLYVAGDILFKRVKINFADLHHPRGVQIIYQGEQ
jgi:hypothetical protein